MGFQVSPGVNVSEIDLSTVVPATSTTEGAIAGVFRWGPVNERILISSEVELVRRFGKPVIGWNEETFFTAADFLSYSDALYVVRVSDGVKAAGAELGDVESIQAKYPGALGNSIAVQVLTGAGDFDYAPDAGNFHIVVADADGAISGTAGSVLETFENVSVTKGSRNSVGANNYIVDVLEGQSRYIEIVDPSAIVLVNMTAAETLAGGTDGSNEYTADVTEGYDLFVNADEVDVSLVLSGVGKAATANYIISNILEKRRDCVGFFSPSKTDVTAGEKITNVLAWADAVGIRSSYAIMDSGYKYRYDKYNDAYVWTPLNGDIAGLCVRTDDQRDPWFSPAGYQRGMVKNVIKLAWNPNQTERDQLYKKGVNPVITQAGQGTILFGDKTFQGFASAFDRINVRRLFIVLEKAIANASKAMLFEFNDEFTRAQFRNMVEPFLRDVQGRRGIYDFKVVADESNNTPEVIDTNRFVGDIYIKPARSINFIQLNFVAVRTGVEFSEIVGQ